jgi:hypothetical protein
MRFELCVPQRTDERFGEVFAGLVEADSRGLTATTRATAKCDALIE